MTANMYKKNSVHVYEKDEYTKQKIIAILVVS